MRWLIVDEYKFRIYLEKKNLSFRVVGDYISRCKRVERYEGDLDSNFIKDGGANIIRKLTYTKEDEKMCRQPIHSIEFKGSKGFTTIFDGTHSLRNAVESYFEFKRS